MTMLDGAPFDVSDAQIATLAHHAELGSTMDEAHRLGASGSPAGTLVLADRQRLGRGRNGKRWSSERGDGLYFTLLERAVTPAALEVLSLRVGLALAHTVAPWCDGVVGLKWPNDVLVRIPGQRALAKLAGVLVEARWRESVPEWVAIGVGVNLKQPDVALSDVALSDVALSDVALSDVALADVALADAARSDRIAAALRPGVMRARVLTALVPRLRAAARADGVLTATELAQWRGRDAMVGQVVQSPGAGVVEGINASGALVLSGRADTSRPEPSRVLRTYRSGSLIIAEEAFAC